MSGPAGLEPTTAGSTRHGCVPRVHRVGAGRMPAVAVVIAVTTWPNPRRRCTLAVHRHGADIRAAPGAWPGTAVKRARMGDVALTQIPGGKSSRRPLCATDRRTMLNARLTQTRGLPGGPFVPCPGGRPSRSAAPGWDELLISPPTRYSRLVWSPKHAHRTRHDVEPRTAPTSKIAERVRRRELL
jgi:hypothetical protein